MFNELKESTPNEGLSWKYPCVTLPWKSAISGVQNAFNLSLAVRWRQEGGGLPMEEPVSCCFAATGAQLISWGLLLTTVMKIIGVSGKTMLFWCRQQGLARRISVGVTYCTVHIDIIPLIVFWNLLTELCPFNCKLFIYKFSSCITELIFFIEVRFLSIFGSVWDESHKIHKCSMSWFLDKNC